MSSELRNLQTAFQAHVLHGDPAIVDRVTDSTRLRADERLAVYDEAYRLRLLEVLSVDFPKLHTLAGDAGFERLGRAYIDACPSAYFSVRYFGARLSGFLRNTGPFGKTPSLSEMAAFEWALGLAFDAADRTLLTEHLFESLGTEQWPCMRLVMHPSLQRLDLEWNIPAIWKAIESEETPRPPERLDFPQAWLVWRHELQARFRSLQIAEARALDAVLGGASFATLCEGLCAWLEPDEVPRQAATWLKRWVRDGLVCDRQTLSVGPRQGKADDQKNARK
jgi:hypothetical protein